ncbi:hypothetical protein D8674_027276 [Pyrus ussuriensis x Pyrus communis]|uniref:Uncharacterized protein n=1 Tax=Pyrus ussuriensis x Pyrus communis TaxID=2448454 RepID=A0A5N5IE25_9ROSA|nr:hypothetical protein D8674_027276 [Pyrus ussuriensis x Pyrus communis]
MTDPMDKHVISLAEKFKFHKSKLDDTGSSKELRDVPNSPPFSFPDSIHIYDVEPEINLDAILGNGFGNITVDLRRPDMGLALHGQMEIRNGENHNNFPIRSNLFLLAQETVETGYTLEEAPKNLSSAPASPNTKPPGARARRKRKRGEDPKTYVPLAVRERKEDDYYWHHF